MEKLKNVKNLKIKLITLIAVVVLLIVQIGPFIVLADENQLKFSFRYINTPADNEYYGTSMSFSEGWLGESIAYCLDYTLYVPGASGTIVNYLRDASPVTTAALMYGYPNYSAAQLGTNSDEEARFATQLAVWSIAKSANPTDSLKANVIVDLDNFTPRAGYEGYMQRATAAAKRIISRAINNPNYVNPHMYANTADVQLTNQDGLLKAGPYKVVATGYNVTNVKASLANAPQSAKIVDAKGNAKDTFNNGDTFYVYMNEKEDGSTLKINLTSKGSTTKGKIYGTGNLNDGKQDFVKLSKEPIELNDSVELRWPTLTGSIEFRKIDQFGNLVPGAKFELRDENGKVVAQATVPEDGIVKFQNIKIGKYTLVETEAPDGYILPIEGVNIVVSTNVVTRFNFQNRKVVGGLKIIKVDENNKPLAGVKFQILDANKKVVETITTNSKGEAATNTLALGKYYYKEVEAPEWVIKDTTEHAFTIASENKTIEVRVENELVKGKFKIVKKDENNTPLAGVTFQILDANKKVVQTITTGTDGTAETKELKGGTYYYKETKVPAGIILDTTEHEFTMGYKNVSKEVVNYFEKGKLKMIKVDENEVPLEGIKFEIYDSNKKLVDTIVTDKKGIAQSKALVMGKYYYKEVEAPNNIIIDSKMYEFTLKENDQVVVANMVNNYKKGDIKIIKVDENEVPLEGITFEIYNKDKQLVDTIVTNSKGIAESKKLVIGKYYYKETKAPNNIIVDNTMYEVEIVKDGQVAIANMINYYKKGSVEFVKIDDTGAPIAGVTFQIFDSNKKIVAEVTTNEEGKAILGDLVLGTYYYKEVSAPDNVVIDKKLYEFEIVENKQVVTKEIINKRVQGELEIIKKDKDTKKTIPGVTFQLLNEKREVIDSGITDENGIVKFSGLLKGKYYFKEIEAPSNYIMDSGEYEFNVEYDSQVIVKVVYNDPKKLPVTGGFIGTDTLIVLVVAAVVIIGYTGTMLVLKNKKNKNGQNNE
ncbi:MAG: SpaA isopeptide-forming pilin-related protein [Clostridia bacterium]|nr:SpaA isopeptide-forming pilin-related protein [Clostridia bacterium]